MSFFFKFILFKQFSSNAIRYYLIRIDIWPCYTHSYSYWTTARLHVCSYATVYLEFISRRFLLHTSSPRGNICVALVSWTTTPLIVHCCMWHPPHAQHTNIRVPICGTILFFFFLKLSKILHNHKLIATYWIFHRQQQQQQQQHISIISCKIV